MAQLRRDSDEYAKRGAKLLGVVVQRLTRLEAYLRGHPMPYPMLADEKREVTRAYGVYIAFGLDSFRIARPATFLIDPAGTVRFIHVGKHQFDRPRPERVWQALDALGGPRPAGSRPG